MALNRVAILAAAGAFAVIVPAVALFPVALTPARGDGAAIGAITPAPAPVVAASYERDLFAAEAGADMLPADAPALVGIAGRLNRDAVALVRLSDGRSRSLKLGESVEGWRLESLAIDAAFFTRGRERVRVAMAADEAPADPPPQ